MTSRPDEPAADDLPEGTQPGPNEPPEQDSVGWEVPHLNHAPAAPQHVPPGSFLVEREPERGLAPALPGNVDLTTIATLVAGVPWAVGSFMVVALAVGFVSLLLPIDALVLPLIGLWLVSGVVVFLPDAEPFLARLLGLRAPTESESLAIVPAWHEVAGRADIEADAYSIWIDDREALNSCLPGAHFLAVARTITRIPGNQQAAALAHEVAHHLGGQAWARLLVHWYSAPARWVVRMYRSGLRASSRVKRSAGLGALGCAATLLWLLIGVVTIVGFATTPEIRPALIVLPLMPWLSRWAERRCDRVAADLGFGRDLLDLFEWWQDSGFDEPRPGGLVRQAFSSHPSVANRIHALRTYMTENGLT